MDLLFFSCFPGLFFWAAFLASCARGIAGNFDSCGRTGSVDNQITAFGEVVVPDAKPSLKQKAAHEAREYFVISFYLFVMFSLLVLYKSVILAENHIPFALHGLALINALALAKVMLVGQELHLADKFHDAPLIYPTLLKSFVFTIVLVGFKIAEASAMGAFHGKTLREGIAEIEGGSWSAILTLMAFLFVVLIPFFGFTELRRIFGPDRLVGVFFHSRRLLNPPSAGS
jgi:hypothetical protein